VVSGTTSADVVTTGWLTRHAAQADPALVSHWARDLNHILGVATGGYHSMWVNLGLYVMVVQSAVSGTTSADVVTTGWSTTFGLGPDM
jgi:hypothetical protein